MTGTLAGKRILLVEDEYFIAFDLKQALQEQDAVVIGPVRELASGMALSEEPLDAAVLDVNLEGALSFPLADRLAERHVPLLFVTGYDGWSMPENYRAMPRIAKPFAMDRVLDAVTDLIAAQ